MIPMSSWVDHRPADELATVGLFKEIQGLETAQSSFQIDLKIDRTHVRQRRVDLGDPSSSLPGRSGLWATGWSGLRVAPPGPSVPVRVE
jgi:hypothetical protein